MEEELAAALVAVALALANELRRYLDVRARRRRKKRTRRTDFRS
jgi:hypothetical protein